MRYYITDRRLNKWAEKEIEDEEEFLLSYMNREHYVWDCDNCDTRYYYAGFSSGKYFKVYHEYGYNPWREDDDGLVVNDFYLEEISKEEAMKNGVISDRDWIRVASFGNDPLRY